MQNQLLAARQKSLLYLAVYGILFLLLFQGNVETTRFGSGEDSGKYNDLTPAFEHNSPTQSVWWKDTLSIIRTDWQTSMLNISAIFYCWNYNTLIATGYTTLNKSQALHSEIEDVLLFLRKHLLHWVETTSLLGLISDAVGMLGLLHMVVPVRTGVHSHLIFTLIGIGRQKSCNV